MKTFTQFLIEIKTIKYKGAWKHKVYHKGRVTNVGAGRAVPINPGSGAGDGGDGGDGD